MKKRILFVESNPLLLENYASMLADEPDRWDVAGATDANQALELLENSPFDIVAANMRLRGVAGTELMTTVKSRFPQASRIIISDYTGQEEFARSLDTTHQFLATPFDARTLKSLLSRIGALDAYLQDPELRKLLGKVGTLPSLPSPYVQIMKELAAEEPSMTAIGEIVAKDPGLTAKLLQIVNSAVVGLSQTVSSPLDAVEYLGTGTVRSLALSAPIFSCFNPGGIQGLSIQQLWDHAIRTAGLAQAIMRLENADSAEAEDAYTAGMLHDVGKVLLANALSSDFQRAIALARQRPMPLHQAELETFGATHAAVAACLLGLWGLPAPIVEAVAFHHSPERSDTRAVSPLTAVHAANVLDHELFPASAGGQPSELATEYLTAIGAGKRLDAWRAEALKLSRAEA
jgi:HD-like signal output (HDOD) protein